ncbi:DUF7221 family queuine tRNA-ribosyltransferase-like protein [Amycolatopsis anabasis]|uniref:deazapurine DNA modification protein DpdA family protein n=1 Tax=Amycolatopsis anabasis TaxID=1840409 RepID=UPI003CCDD803
MDSGSYTEITRFGTWRCDPDLFGSRVTRVLDNVGTPPVFCAPQDIPCEPQARAASGLPVAEHQSDTIENLIYLREQFPFVPWLPVLQGWEPDQYLDHAFQYRCAGIDLTREPLVGVGSLCRRGAGQTSTVVRIIRSLRDLGITLHRFGVSQHVLARCPVELSSVDSLAWSRSARWHGRAMPGCAHPGSCTNCADFALRWHRRATSLVQPRHRSLRPLRQQRHGHAPSGVRAGRRQ